METRRHYSQAVDLGTALESFKQDEAGATVELSKIVNGQKTTEEAAFAYLVGTDGAHSTQDALSLSLSPI